MAASTHLAKHFALFLVHLSVLSQICNGAYHANVLFSRENLYKSESLNNGDYTLKLQDDCRLGLYDAGKRIWASSNAGFDRFCISTLNDDGNFDIYSKTLGLLWSAFSVLENHPKGEYALILQNDRNLVIHGPALWCAPSDYFNLHDDPDPDYFYLADDTDVITDPFPKKMITDADVSCEADKGIVLYTGQRLSAGECLKFGKYALKMQKDCNLVLYEGDESIWATNTSGLGQNCYLRMRNDGNLVVYRPDFRELWTAFDTRKDYGNYVLVLQQYGGIAIYDTPIWSTGTNIANEDITATNRVADVL